MGQSPWGSLLKPLLPGEVRKPTIPAVPEPLSIKELQHMDAPRRLRHNGVMVATVASLPRPKTFDLRIFCEARGHRGSISAIRNLNEPPTLAPKAYTRDVGSVLKSRTLP